MVQWASREIWRLLMRAAAKDRRAYVTLAPRNVFASVIVSCRGSLIRARRKNLNNKSAQVHAPVTRYADTARKYVTGRG